MGLESLIADVACNVQPLRAFFGLKTVVFLRVVERFEVNYYDALSFVS